MKKLLLAIFTLSLFLVGNAQSALDFDEISGKYVNVPTNPMAGLTSFTIETWCKPEFLTGLLPYEELLGPASGSGFLEITTAGAIYLRDGLGSNCGRTVDGTFPINDGLWHHIAYVYDETLPSGSRNAIYLDGVATTLASNLDFGGWANAALHIGDAVDYYYYDGEIDNMSIWGVARSAVEVASDFANCLSGTEPGLVAHWDLNEGTGSATISDLTGNGHTGTLTNFDINADWTLGADCVNGACTISDQSVWQSDTTFWCEGNTTINVASSEVGLYYFLRDDPTGEIMDGPKQGTGSGLVFYTDNIYETTTYNVFSTKGTALDFDGVNDYVTLPADPALDFTGDCTIECIFNKTGTQFGSLYSQWEGATSQRRIELHVTASQQVRLLVSEDNVTNYQVMVVDPIALNQWTHVAAVFEAGVGIKIYINGEEKTTTSLGVVPNSIWAASSITSIGNSRQGTGNLFMGKIDELRVWDRVRTQGEILANMVVNLGGGESNLSACWNFEDGAGSSVVSEITPNGNNANMYNMDPSTDWVAGIMGGCELELTNKPTVDVFQVAEQGVFTFTSELCPGNAGASLEIASSQVGVDYELRDDSDDSVVDGPYPGTGSAIAFNTGPVVSSKTFNVYGKRMNGPIVECDHEMSILVPIIVQDILAPMPDLTALPDVTAECSVEALFPPTGTDACVGPVLGVTAMTFPITAQGTTFVSWTYNDGNGNSSLQVQKVIITDTQAPLPDLTSLPDINSECSVTPIAPTAVDNCVGPVTATPSVAFPITDQGNTVITWTYYDGHGNVSTQTQNVNIVDTTVPVADVPVLADVTGVCDAFPVAPTATDNCSGTITAIPDITFPITDQGTTMVTWTFDDGHGNFSTQTQNVILSDTEAPTLVAPTDIVVSANNPGCSGVVTLTGELVSDNCAVASVTHDAPSVFPVGTTNVTWTATDIHGNETSAIQAVTIENDLSAFVASQIDPSGCGMMDGSILLNLTGGTGPFTYDWNDGEFVSQNIVGVGSGSYMVSVTDANGCNSTILTGLSDPSAPDIVVDSTVDPVCFGANDGMVEITVTGGSGDYTFDWSNDGIGDYDDSEDNMTVGSGSVTVVVMDSNGCSSTETMTIEQPDQVTLEQDISVCFGNTVDVGTSVYDVSGIYTDVLTTVMGCDSIVTTNVTIMDAEESTETHFICQGETVWVGDNPFTEAGVYTEVFQSDLGCDSTVTIYVALYTLVNTNVVQDVNVLTSQHMGALYQWYDCNTGMMIGGAFDQSFSPTVSGSYAVEVTSVDGCIEMSECMEITLVGIEENDFEVPVTVFPNPTSGVVNIQLGKVYEDIQISVKNVLGQVVLSQVYSNSEFLQFEIIGEDGMYFLEINAGTGENATVKILKQ